MNSPTPSRGFGNHVLQWIYLHGQCLWRIARIDGCRCALSGHVAGISTGLVTEHDDNGNISKHVVLTDIIGAEDHFGDMDFKVCAVPVRV